MPAPRLPNGRFAPGGRRPTAEAVDLDQLGDALEAWILRQVQEDDALLRTLVAEEVAQRTLHQVVVDSAEQVRDRGDYEQGWSVQDTPEGFDVVNSVPYAGVVELGRRPMRPGPPLQPILEYIQRKRPDLEPEAQEALARTTRDAIHIYGTPAKHILGNLVEREWPGWFRDAVDMHVTHRRRT